MEEKEGDTNASIGEIHQTGIFRGRRSEQIVEFVNQVSGTLKIKISDHIRE